METRWRWWWTVSLVAHASLVTVAVRVAPARPMAPASAPVSVDVTPLSDSLADSAAGTSPHGPRDPRALRLGGSDSAQNVSSDNPGERGDGRSLESARMLAARADGVNLDPRQLNTVGPSQEQRIRTSRERASPQDDRRTPNPADDPWASHGGGVLLVRMRDARALPAEGALVHPGESLRAGDEVPAAATAHADLPTVAVGSERNPGARPRLAAGVRVADGHAARAAGPVATQRPSVEHGHASTTSDQAALRPSDDADAALLAASLMRAHVSASAQQGAQRAEGAGGVGGGGSPGSGGGLGRGGVAHALGSGDGVLSLDTGDTRYVRYFGMVRRRIARLTERAFPYEEALRLRQGRVIVNFTIERDGRVGGVDVQRASGVPAYDANVRRALGAGTMPPIPATLGRDRVTIRALVEFLNPVVR